MAVSMLTLATEALSNMFGDHEIPDNFSCNGQMFEERCESWIRYAVDQLYEEIHAFEDTKNRKHDEDSAN